MKNIVFTFLTTLIITTSYSQVSMSFSTYNFYYYKNIQERAPLEKKILVVKEFQFTKGQIKSFKKEGTYDEAMKSLRIRNERLIQLIKKCWTFNTEIVSSANFETEKEYRENNKYIWIEVREDMTTGKTVRDIHYTLNYSLTTLRGNHNWYNSFSHFNGISNELEFVCGLIFIQKGLNAAQNGIKGKYFSEHVNKGGTQLKNKTLLIPQECTELSLEQITEKYSCNAKIVPFSEVMEKVDSKNSNYVFYLPQYEGGGTSGGYHHVIYSCENLEPLVLLKAKTVKAGTFGGNSSVSTEIFGGSPGGTVYITRILKKGAIEDINSIVTGP
jgi:hypothetical protein